jgi:hypothetical protein
MHGTRCGAHAHSAQRLHMRHAPRITGPPPRAATQRAPHPIIPLVLTAVARLQDTDLSLAHETTILCIILAIPAAIGAHLIFQKDSSNGRDTNMITGGFNKRDNPLKMALTIKYAEMLSLYNDMKPESLADMCTHLQINPVDLVLDNAKIRFVDPVYSRNTREITISIATADPANTAAFTHFLLQKLDVIVYVRHDGAPNPVSLKVRSSKLLNSEEITTDHESQHIVTAVVNLPPGVLASPDDIMANIQEQATALNTLSGGVKLKMDLYDTEGKLDGIKVIKNTTIIDGIEIESSGLKFTFNARDKLWRSQQNTTTGTTLQGWDYTRLISIVIMEVTKILAGGEMERVRMYIEILYYELPGNPCKRCLTCVGAHPETHTQNNCLFPFPRCMGCYNTVKTNAGMRNDLSHFCITNVDKGCNYLSALVAGGFKPPLPPVAKTLSDFPTWEDDENPATLLLKNVAQTTKDNSELKGSYKRKAEEAARAFVSDSASVNITYSINIHIQKLTILMHGSTRRITPRRQTVMRSRHFDKLLGPTSAIVSRLRSATPLGQPRTKLRGRKRRKLNRVRLQLHLQPRRRRKRKLNFKTTKGWKWTAWHSKPAVSKPNAQWGPLLYAGVNKLVRDALLITVYTTHNTSYLKITFIGQRRPLPCYEPPSRRPRPPRVAT